MSNSKNTSGADSSTEKDQKDQKGREGKVHASDAPHITVEPIINDPYAPPPKKETTKRRRIFLYGGIGVLVLAVAGLLYWLYARQFESTDDAFIDGDIVQVAPKVSAYVNKVYVEGNQFVHKGDLLVDLNPETFQIKLEQAKAALL